MNLTKVCLLLCSILIIVMYFNMAFYDRWLKTKALSENNSMFDQMQNLDVDFRNHYRFGATYSFDKDVQRTLAGKPNVTLLMPNNAYMKSMNVTSLDMQEPAVFYYFTGINSVWASSPNVEKANWAIYAGKTGVRVMQIKSKGQLDSLILIYKKFAN